MSFVDFEVVSGDGILTGSVTNWLAWTVGLAGFGIFLEISSINRHQTIYYHNEDSENFSKKGLLESKSFFLSLSLHKLSYLLNVFEKNYSINLKF